MLSLQGPDQVEQFEELGELSTVDWAMCHRVAQLLQIQALRARAGDLVLAFDGAEKRQKLKRVGEFRTSDPTGFPLARGLCGNRVGRRRSVSAG